MSHISSNTDLGAKSHLQKVAFKSSNKQNPKASRTEGVMYSSALPVNRSEDSFVLKQFSLSKEITVLKLCKILLFSNNTLPHDAGEAVFFYSFITANTELY